MPVWELWASSQSVRGLLVLCFCTGYLGRTATIQFSCWNNHFVPVFCIPFLTAFFLTYLGQTCVCVSVVRNSHSLVWKWWERTLKCVNDWLRSLGSLALFSCCCTVEGSWIYCIFFPLRRGLGWHLLQYCDDYMKIVNCTEFTYRICSFKFWFHIKICIFFPQTGRSSCTVPRFCSPRNIFFFRAMIKSNLTSVNKYYGIKNMNVTSKTYLNELVKGFKNEGPPCLFNDFLFLFCRKKRFFLSEMAVFPLGFI